MNKNHEGGAGGILGILGRQVPAMIVCSDPLAKSAFVEWLIGAAGGRATYVDADLLHSGYAASGMIRGRGVEVLRPSREWWAGCLARAVSAASSGGGPVIVDSLNGIYRIAGGPDAVRPANSGLMLLSQAARDAGSSAVITAMVRRGVEGDWFLYPGGRWAVRSAGLPMYYVKRAGSRIVLAGLGEGQSGSFEVDPGAPAEDPPQTPL